MKKLKVGIVGCGFIARGKHLPALKNLSDTAEITALCDIIKERADDMNEKFANGKAKIFTDYKEMLKLELDAVYRANTLCARNLWQSTRAKRRKCSTLKKRAANF